MAESGRIMTDLSSLYRVQRERENNITKFIIHIYKNHVKLINKLILNKIIYLEAILLEFLLTACYNIQSNVDPVR